MDIYVMTGDFMTGKTTWIGHMVEQAAARFPQMRIAGVYTPAVFESGVKTAIDAVLLPDGTRFLFAPRKEADGEQPDGLHRLGWDFRADALERINLHLASCTPCDLLVVDELGPLELLRGGGYTAAIDLLDARRAPNALLVVRPALLDVARERWGEFETLGPDSDVSGFLARISDSFQG